MKRLFTIILSLLCIGLYAQETPPNGTKQLTTNQGYIGPDSTIYQRVAAQGVNAFYTQMVRNKALKDSLKNIRLSTVNRDIHVFLIAGQSNAQGSSQDSINAPLVLDGTGYQYYLNSIKRVYKNVGDGNGGAWPSFINEYYRRKGIKILMVPTAKGNTSMTAAANTGNGTWDTTGTLFSNSVTKVQQAMAAATAAGYNPIFKGVLWSQGETDAGFIFSGTITKNDYALAFTKMIRNYRAQFGSTMPFYIFRLGAKPGDLGAKPIRSVQDSISEADPNSPVVFRDAITFFARGLLRPDETHYTQAGYNQMGEIGAGNVFSTKRLDQVKRQYNQIGIGIGEPFSALDIGGDSTISIKSIPKISGGNSGIGFNGAVNVTDQVNPSATKFAGRIPVWDFNSTLTTNGTEYEDLFTIRHRGSPTASAVKRSLAINMHLSNQSSAGEAAKNGGFELRSMGAFATVPNMYWFVGNKEHGRFGNDGSLSMNMAQNAPFNFYNGYVDDANNQRLMIDYSSSRFNITSTSSGSGVRAPITFGAVNTKLVIDDAGSANGFFGFPRSTSGSNLPITVMNGALSASTGNNQILKFDYAINQSGTAGFDIIDINVTENTKGSGNSNILNLKSGGAGRFVLNTNGNASFGGVLGFNINNVNKNINIGTAPASAITNQALFRENSGDVTAAPVYKTTESDNRYAPKISPSFTSGSDGARGVLITGNSPTQSGLLLDVQNSAGSTVSSISNDGIITAASLSNQASFNNSALLLNTTSATIRRNVADSNPALIVNNLQGTGDIFRVQQNGVNQLNIDATGLVTLAGRVYSSLAPTLPEHLTNKQYVDARGNGYNFTASGNGSATAIVIPHGLSGITTNSVVIPSAKNTASAGFTFTTIDANNITINYTVAPASGTNNLSYSVFIKP